MPITDAPQKRTKTMALVVGLTWAAATTMADGPGHSFTSLESPFTQELYGVTAEPVADAFLGGVAFGPDGDVWATECLGARYHLFDRQGPVSDGHGGTVRSESLVDFAAFDPMPIGCGIVNHPAPFLGVPALFANTLSGLWPIAADTGQPIWGGPVNSPSLYAGNGRGIDIDPVVTTDHHIVYTGADCDPNVKDAATCSLFDYSSASESTLAFARFNRTPTESFGGLNFTPDGSAVFVSYQDTDSGERGLLVLGRPAALMGRNVVDNSQIIRRIVMPSMPQGIAFREAGDFAVTLNEDGTMTKLVFPAPGFSGVPVQTPFASGGFRGGHLRVGADGCIHAPQGRVEGGENGVRFGDNVEAASDSVVRICGGFTPAPGVAGAEWSSEPGRISGSAFADWNHNGLRDTNEPGITDLAIALNGAATDSTTTDNGGSYAFEQAPAGSYSVSAPGSVSGLSGNPTPLAVELGSGEQRTGVDFPYTESTQPVCSATTPSGTPTRIDFTLRDGGGLRRVIVRAITNLQVSVGGGAATTSPTTVDFATPEAGDVSVSAMRSNAAQAAALELDVVDAFGNQASCASSIPASSTPPPPTTPTPKPKPHHPKPHWPKPHWPKPHWPNSHWPKPQQPQPQDPIRRELTGEGRFDIDVAKHVANSMKYVTIRNGRKGLESVEVFVNHRRFLSGRLRDGQVKTIDVSRALVPGTKNRIVLVGRGGRRDSAVVTISSKP